MEIYPILFDPYYSITKLNIEIHLKFIYLKENNRKDGVNMASQSVFTSVFLLFWQSINVKISQI